MAPVLIAVAAGLVAAGGWYELRKKGKTKAPPAAPAVSASPSPPPKASAPKASAPAPKSSAPSTPAPKAGDPAPAPKGVTDPFAEGAKFSDKPLDAAGGKIDQTTPLPGAEQQTDGDGTGEEKSLTDKASDALKDLAGGLGLGG